MQIRPCCAASPSRKSINKTGLPSVSSVRSGNGAGCQWHSKSVLARHGGAEPRSYSVPNCHFVASQRHSPLVPVRHSLAWCWNLSESTRAIIACDTYLEESRVHVSARVRRSVNRVRSGSARGYIFDHVLDAGAILTTAGNGFRARCIARREEDRAARTPTRFRTA